MAYLYTKTVPIVETDPTANKERASTGVGIAAALILSSSIRSLLCFSARTLDCEELVHGRSGIEDKRPKLRNSDHVLFPKPRPPNG